MDQRVFPSESAHLGRTGGRPTRGLLLPIQRLGRWRCPRFSTLRSTPVLEATAEKTSPRRPALRLAIFSQRCMRWSEATNDLRDRLIALPGDRSRQPGTTPRPEPERSRPVNASNRERAVGPPADRTAPSWRHDQAPDARRPNCVRQRTEGQAYPPGRPTAGGAASPPATLPCRCMAEPVARQRTGAKKSTTSVVTKRPVWIPYEPRRDQRHP